MPNRMFGFNNVNSAGATPYPGRTVAVTATVGNTTFVTFDVTSNLPNTTIKYNLVNTTSADFTDNKSTDTFTTDANGSFTFSKTLVTTSPSVSNVDFFADILSINDLSLATSTNVSIINQVPIVATGGTITFSNGYKVHTFSSNSSFNVSSIDTATNANVYIAMCGGGGSSGLGLGSNSSFYSRLPGGGGAGGEVIMANLTVNDFNVSSYTAIVGTGGFYTGSFPNVTLQSGGNTSFKGYAAEGGAHGGSWNAPAPSGFKFGGGGGSMVEGDNTISTYHYVQNTTPVDEPLFSTWFNPDASINGILYYKSEANVYSTWDSGGDQVPKVFANAFNNANLRISNEGGDGSIYDGGNAVVGSLGFDCLVPGQPFNSCITLFSLVAPGGGAGANGNGYDGTGYWGLGNATNSLQLTAGNGGKGVIVWADDPTTTFPSSSSLRFYKDYDSIDPSNTANIVAMFGAGGGGGGGQTGQFSATTIINPGRPLKISGTRQNGTGLGGTAPVTYSTGGTQYAIDRGSDGVVKIAYLNTIRQFAT